MMKGFSKNSTKAKEEEGSISCPGHSKNLVRIGTLYVLSNQSDVFKKKSQCMLFLSQQRPLQINIFRGWVMLEF